MTKQKIGIKELQEARERAEYLGIDALSAKFSLDFSKMNPDKRHGTIHAWDEGGLYLGEFTTHDRALEHGAAVARVGRSAWFVYRGTWEESPKQVTTPEALLKYAKSAVRSEVREPYHGSGAGYDQQAVIVDVLNHFDDLTNSDEDFERIKEAVDAAEDELLCAACHVQLKGEKDRDGILCDDCYEAETRETS